MIQVPSHVKTAISAWIAKAVTIVSKLITIPLLIGYLGVDCYAAFVLLLYLEGWFLLCDFGIAFSLQNFISEHHVQKKSIDDLLKAGAVFSVIAFLLGLLLSFLIQTPLTLFLLGKIVPRAELYAPIFTCAALLFLLGTLGAIGSRIYYAKHEGAKVHYLQALASFISMLATILLIRHYEGEDRLLYSLVLSIGVPSVASFLLWIKSFMRLNWKTGWDRSLIVRIAQRAKDFWIFSCLAACVLLIDSFVMARTVESAEIIEYNFLHKLFGVAAFAFTALLQGLWPSFSEMMASQNFSAVSHKIIKYCKIGIGIVLSFTFILLLFSKWIQLLFFDSAQEVRMPWSTILLFGLYHSVRVISDLYAMALQSFSHLKIFLVLVPFQALVSITMQYFLSKEYGINGILGGLILSYLVTVFWALPIRFHQLQRRHRHSVS